MTAGLVNGVTETKPEGNDKNVVNEMGKHLKKTLFFCRN
jgi:hypothetical protein